MEQREITDFNLLRCRLLERKTVRGPTLVFGTVKTADSFTNQTEIVSLKDFNFRLFVNWISVGAVFNIFQRQN